MYNYIPLFLTKLISIVSQPDIPKILFENTGKISYTCFKVKLVI